MVLRHAKIPKCVAAMPPVVSLDFASMQVLMRLSAQAAPCALMVKPVVPKSWNNSAKMMTSALVWERSAMFWELMASRVVDLSTDLGSLSVRPAQTTSAAVVRIMPSVARARLDVQ